MNGAKTQLRNARRPRQLTAKQELFCQGLAKGLSQSDAYRVAYCALHMKPETVHKEASRLAADPRVKLKVRLFRGAVSAKSLIAVGYSIDQAFQELREAGERATRKGDVRSMLRLTREKAKLAGLL